MERIVHVHFGEIRQELVREALRAKDAKSAIPPRHGALLKNEQDVHLFERLAFLSRRDGR